jgi:hypothetical protein
MDDLADAKLVNLQARSKVGAFESIYPPIQRSLTPFDPDDRVYN